MKRVEERLREVEKMERGGKRSINVVIAYVTLPQLSNLTLDHSSGIPQQGLFDETNLTTFSRSCSGGGSKRQT